MTLHTYIINLPGPIERHKRSDHIRARHAFRRHMKRLMGEGN